MGFKRFFIDTFPKFRQWYKNSYYCLQQMVRLGIVCLLLRKLAMIGLVGLPDEKQFNRIGSLNTNVKNV